MKYSMLMPIRSIKETYTPFSGLNSRKLTHKRAQSETPSINTMGIQCDSLEFIDTFGADNTIMPPEIKISTINQENAYKQPITIQNTSKIVEKLKVRAASPDVHNENSNNEIASKTQMRIKFAKVGDWNDTYILKQTNTHSGIEYKRPYCGYLSRNSIRKPCKIVEFCPVIMVKIRQRCDRNLPWQFKSSDKGIFHISSSRQGYKKK